MKRRSDWVEEDAPPNFTIGSYATGFEHPLVEGEAPEKRQIGFVDSGALRAIGCLKSRTTRKAKPPKRKK